jgi:hypothetical protein
MVKIGKKKKESLLLVTGCWLVQDGWIKRNIRKKNSSSGYTPNLDVGKKIMKS